MLGAYPGKRGIRRKELNDLLGDVEGSERKGTYVLPLKDKPQFTRWKNEGRAFPLEETAYAKTQKNGIAKPSLV